jgi:hypothetical protein
MLRVLVRLADIVKVAINMTALILASCEIVRKTVRSFRSLPICLYDFLEGLHFLVMVSAYDDDIFMFAH